MIESPQDLIGIDQLPVRASKMISLDGLDRRLLHALQRDASLSAQALSADCHASIATVHRRLRRLKNAGVIRRQISLVDERYAARPIKVVIEVTLERQDQVSQIEFQKAMRASKDVTVCRMITGEGDYLVDAHFASNADLNAFIDTRLAAQAGVKKYRTVVVLREIKYDPAVSL